MIAAAQLSADTFLVVACGAKVVRVSAVGAGPRLEVETESFAPKSPSPAARQPLSLTFVYLPGSVTASGALERLRFEVDSADRIAKLADVVTDLKTLIRNTLAPLDSHTRAGVVEFLATTLGRDPDRGIAQELSESLWRAREVLRERLPYGAASGSQRRALHVDRLVAVDQRHCWVRGWMRDSEAGIVSLVAVAPEGSRTAVLEKLVREPLEAEGSVVEGDERAAGGDPGERFLGCFATELPTHRSDGWIFEMRNEVGSGVEVGVSSPIEDSDEGRAAILEDLTSERLGNGTLMREHFLPALGALQQRLRAAVPVAGVADFGPSPGNPEVTVVTVLSAGADNPELQLAQFVRDADMPGTELIYVVDGPALADRFLPMAEDLFKLYRTPFRAVSMEHRAGFAVASAAGADLARGRLLLLLHAEILPRRPGWMTRLVSTYDSIPSIGALGARLLREDGMIHSAGMGWQGSGTSLPGMLTELDGGEDNAVGASRAPTAVGAVNPACLMVGRECFSRHGGIGGDYLTAEYAGADLCLRLLRSGHQNWCAQQADLSFLEDPAGRPRWAAHGSLYDRWLLAHNWGEEVARL